jgi:hypothetical protein
VTLIQDAKLESVGDANSTESMRGWRGIDWCVVGVLVFMFVLDGGI